MDNNIRQQENIQIQPEQPRINKVGPPKEDRPQREVEPRKKPRWFWILVATVIFGGGLIVLIFVGDVFIREVTQEVIIEERTAEPDISSASSEEGRGRATYRAESSEVGPRLAPYFELENLKGEKVKISDFLGSPVVVTFWTTWNILSVDQLRILSEVELLEVGPPGEVRPLFRIIAINSQEDRSIVSNFIERGGYDVEVLLDENGAVGEMYKVQTLPVTYFLDRDGNIADVYVGLLDAEAIVDKAGRILSEE